MLTDEYLEMVYDKNVRTNALIAVRHNGHAVILGAHCTQVTGIEKEKWKSTINEMSNRKLFRNAKYCFSNFEQRLS